MGATLSILYPDCFQFSPLIAGFSTRHLGGDTNALAAILGVQPSSVITVKQIHSNRVVDITSHPSPWPSPAPTGPLRGRGEGTKEGDALVTQEKGLILTIKTADCVPLLVYDPEHTAIAAIHAGWRGLESGIIENTLLTMQHTYSSKPEVMRVAIGPCICQQCFEIGPEVAKNFQKKFKDKAPLHPGNGDRFHLDLIEGCKRVLKQEGIQNSHIETVGLCTACRTDLLYSYRTEGPSTGRLIAFIGLTNIQ